MSQREKFADERRGAESYNEECGVIARWLHDGRLMFSDEADARVAAARREGMERARSHVMAAMRVLKALHPHATSGEIMALGGAAAAIRAEMEDELP